MTLVWPVLAFLVLQAAQPASTPGPRVERMLQQAAPPSPGEVAVQVLTSADTLRIGEQLDVVTLAWLPQDLLARLRRPPVIRPPTIAGAFAAVQPTSPRVAGSRVLRGVRYALYMAHQVVFPLDEGELRIPPAGLAYLEPPGRRGPEVERRVEVASVARVLRIVSPPPGGPGPVASGLRVRWDIDPVVPRVGEPIPVALALAGEGNLALWPAPAIRFPEGTRGYAGVEDASVRLVDGRHGGMRRWTFTVVVDSAGTVVLPDVTYAYFDPELGAWQQAVAKGLVLPVLPPLPGAMRREPLPPPGQRPLGLWAWTRGVLVVIGLLLVVPPFGLLIGRMRQAARARPAVPAQTATARLVARVRATVPEPERRQGDHLAAALREAGLSEAASRDVAALHEAAMAQSYAPPASPARAETEVQAARALAAWPARLTAVLLAAALGAAAPLEAEVAEPVRLAQHASAAWSAAHDADAVAHWVAARRLAPRSPALAAAWRQVSALGPDLARLGRVAPLTPVELAMLASLGWALGWGALMRGRRRMAWISWVSALATAGAAAAVAHAYGRPAAIINRPVTLREAPHGLAPGPGTLDPMAVVQPGATRPGWVRVTSSAGKDGWVPAEALSWVPTADARRPPGPAR